MNDTTWCAKRRARNRKHECAADAALGLARQSMRDGDLARAARAALLGERLLRLSAAVERTHKTAAGKPPPASPSPPPLSPPPPRMTPQQLQAFREAQDRRYGPRYSPSEWASLTGRRLR